MYMTFNEMVLERYLRKTWNKKRGTTFGREVAETGCPWNKICVKWSSGGASLASWWRHQTRNLETGNFSLLLGTKPAGESCASRSLSFPRKQAMKSKFRKTCQKNPAGIYPCSCQKSKRITQRCAHTQTHTWSSIAHSDVLNGCLKFWK